MIESLYQEKQGIYLSAFKKIPLIACLIDGKSSLISDINDRFRDAFQCEPMSVKNSNFIKYIIDEKGKEQFARFLNQPFDSEGCLFHISFDGTVIISSII